MQGLVTAVLLYLPFYTWVVTCVIRARRVPPWGLAGAPLLGGLPMLVHGFLIVFLGSRLFQSMSVRGRPAQMETSIVLVHGLFHGLGHLRDFAFPGPQHLFFRRAATFTTQPRVGHMMPIEEPKGFLDHLAAITSREVHDEEPA